MKSILVGNLPLPGPTNLVIKHLFVPMYARLTTSIIHGASNQHMWGGFKFDEDGNLIDKSGERVFPLAKPEEISKFEKKLHSK